MEKITDNDFLNLQASNKMAHKARRLCDLKYSLDMQSRMDLLQEFQNDWMDSSNTCAFFGLDFFEKIVPFLRHEESVGPSFKAMVDSRLVLGASIKGKPKDISAQEAPERVACYSTHTEYGLGKAEYSWYEQLGIFVAHEGKHRVAFMREQGDLPIAAEVRLVKYPAAERIKIVSSRDGYWRFFAILDGRYLQVLERPDITRWFLSEYGIQECTWESLDTAPSLDLVCAALSICKEKKLDMHKLIDFEDEVTTRQEGQPTKFYEIKNYKFCLLRFFSISAFCILSGLIAVLLANILHWEFFEFIAVGFFSSAVTLMIGLDTLRWKKQPEFHIVAEWFKKNRHMHWPSRKRNLKRSA